MTTDESETEEEIDHWIPLIEAEQKEVRDAYMYLRKNLIHMNI
jgi:hypothetical protein